MSSKRKDKKKIINLKSISSSVLKNMKFNKNQINPTDIIIDTKEKITNFYYKFKKDRERQRIKLEKKRKLDEKKEIQKQKKQAQKERLDKLREEKRQIVAQKKLILDNEKQVRKKEV